MAAVVESCGAAGCFARQPQFRPRGVKKWERPAPLPLRYRVLRISSSGLRCLGRIVSSAA